MANAQFVVLDGHLIYVGGEIECQVEIFTHIPDYQHCIVVHRVFGIVDDEVVEMLAVVGEDGDGDAVAAGNKLGGWL